MKRISISFGIIPSNERSNMPHLMELPERIYAIAFKFGFSAKIQYDVGGTDFDFWSEDEEECSALLLVKIAEEVLDYLQKNGFLSIHVQNINFY